MWTLTKEVQQALTPAQVLFILKEGNKRFMNNLKVNRNLLQQINETSQGQYPLAVILSCIDSRTSAELIFDQSLGHIFSIRIAGNILNDDILGSMEFACKIAGAKLIAVLGHTQCGAIRGACDNVKMGHLTTLIAKILPAVSAEKETPSQDRHAKNDNFVEQVAEINVKMTLEKIVTESPIIRELLANKTIGIIGGMYHIETGEVQFYEKEPIIQDVNEKETYAGF